MAEDMDTEAPVNATRSDLERLNGLLIRALIKKLEDGSSTATDIGNAVKVVISNRVQPVEPEGPFAYTSDIPMSEFGFPFEVEGDG